MNETIAFLSEKNVSYLTGLSIEQILKGNLKEAQELLKAEEKRLDKLPKPVQVMDFPTETHVKVKAQDLPENARICQSCVKQDYANELPFDYTINAKHKGKCDSCGTDTLLTDILVVRSDIETQKEPQKTSWTIAPKLE